jgi:hypothetical protein
MMTTNHTSAADAGMPKQPLKSLSDCQHDAVILAGMIEGIDLMGNEGTIFDEARAATTVAALEHARRLADDLDVLS